MRLPLSEEEQRILQEMEQKLREHDREFVDRVSHRSERLRAPRGVRWSVVAFLAGTVLLLASFRTSLGLGVCGVLIMVVSALSFAQHVGGPRDEAGRSAPAGRRPARSSGIAEEWSEMRRRMRSRFGHRN